MLGLLSFSASGWIVYSLAWWYTGQDAILRGGGSSGVVLGAYWCLTLGVISGAVIGAVIAVLTTRYLQRRRRRAGNLQSSAVA